MDEERKKPGNQETESGTRERIRVGITDDHQMVREGLRAFLSYAKDIEITFLASSGQEALEAVAHTVPDVLLMDLVMPGELNGIEAMAQILSKCPSVRVIALTSFQEPERILAALEAGAIGYLQKDVKPHDLLSAIRQAAAGRSVLDPAAFTALQSLVKAGSMNPSDKAPTGRSGSQENQTASETLEDGQAPGAVPRGGPNGTAAPIEALTAREQEVLEALAGGSSNKEIAAVLCISEKTVKVHISHILGKLGVYDRTQALLAAAKLGLIQLT